MTDLPIDFVHDVRGRPAAVPRRGAADPEAARLLADFLTTEVGRTPAGVDHVAARVEAAAAGATPWEGSGNALAFEISAAGLRLEELWREPPGEARIPLDMLRRALAAWRGVVEGGERRD
jgi:hypothetical protein